MRKDLLTEVIELRAQAWDVAGEHSNLGLAGTCLRSFASFRLLAGSARDPLVGFRVWKRMRARFRQQQPIPLDTEPQRSTLMIDEGPRNAKHAVPYVEAMTGAPVPHFIARDQLPEGLCIATDRAPKVLNRFMRKTAFQCLFSKDRLHRVLGVFTVMELAYILQLVEVWGVKHVVDFAPYSIDHNLLYLLLKKRGVKVTKVPSSGPLRTHNRILLADAVALSTPYHLHEMKQFPDTFHVDEVLKWVPERALEYAAKYATQEAPEPPARTVGFYSHGGWVRAAQDHASDGLNIDAQEQALLRVLGNFVKERPDWKLVVFPHPREKAPEVLQRTRDYYSQFLPLDRIDLRLESTPTAQQFEAADVGVAVFSTIVYERLFCGHKTRIFNLSNPDFPAAGTSLNSICARSETDLVAAIDCAASRTRSEDFEALGLGDYRWDAYPQMTAVS